MRCRQKKETQRLRRKRRIETRKSHTTRKYNPANKGNCLEGDKGELNVLLLSIV